MSIFQTEKEKKHFKKIAGLCTQITILQSQVDRYREALEEICEPTEPDYYLGIRCGIEDRDLQNGSYEAAEYGYDQGKEYCQFIAGQALKESHDH